MRILSNLLVVLLSLAIVLFLLEISIRAKHRFIDNISHCYYSDINYGYCEEYEGVYEVVDDTLGYTHVPIYTDRNGARKPSVEDIADISKAEHIYIGDSFVQADELPYEETFYGRLSEANDGIYAIGYSSWNPYQYAAIVNRLRKNRVTYHVFLMANDFLVNYDRSTYSEYKTSKNIEYYLLRWSSLYKVIKQRVARVAERYAESKTVSSEGSVWDRLNHAQGFDYSRSNINECNSVANLDRGLLLSDYIQFSKSSKCWSNDIRKAVDHTIDVIRDIQNLVANLQDAEVKFYLVPAGWAFQYQNSIGRLSPSYYGIPNNISISSYGLQDYLVENGIHAADLEELFMKHLKTMELNRLAYKDALYLPIDGHWTAYAHELLSKYLIQRSDL